MTKKSRTAAKLEKNEVLVQDYKIVFNSESGKRVLYDLMNSTHMLNSTYQGNKDDMVYAEGMRSVSLLILKKLETDIEQLREAIQRAHDQGVRDYV